MDVTLHCTGLVRNCALPRYKPKPDFIHSTVTVHPFSHRVSPYRAPLRVRTGRWRWVGQESWPPPCLRTAPPLMTSWSERCSCMAPTGVWGPGTSLARRTRCNQMAKYLRRWGPLLVFRTFIIFSENIYNGRTLIMIITCGDFHYFLWGPLLSLVRTLFIIFVRTLFIIFVRTFV